MFYNIDHAFMGHNSIYTLCDALKMVVDPNLCQQMHTLVAVKSAFLLYQLKEIMHVNSMMQK